MLINQKIDKENVVHLNNGVLLSSKKQWHIEICRQWVELEKIILSEATQIQKYKSGMYSLTNGY